MTQSNDTFHRLAELLEECEGLKDLAPKDNLRALGLDSLALVNMQFEFEEEFGVQLASKDLASVATVEDLCTLLEGDLQPHQD